MGVVPAWKGQRDRLQGELEKNSQRANLKSVKRGDLGLYQADDQVLADMNESTDGNSNPDLCQSP